MNIGNGVTCPNCFAYLGAGYLLIMEYSWTYGFAFEVKAAGGAGFNLNLQVSNPSISGSKTLQVMGAGSWQYLTIGTTGLQLGFQIAGLTATLSGSASATGSLSFSAGAGFSASMGVMYANSRLSFPNNFNQYYNPPTLTNNNFQVNAASVSLSLGATENLQLNYLSTAKATFAVTVSPTVALAWGSGVVGAIASVAHALDKPAQGRIRSNPDSTVNYYAPGDTIRITYDYVNCPFTNSTMDLFYSLTDGILTWPFMHRTFTTSMSGNGSFTAKWMLPWNLRFVQSERWKVKVHTSIAMNSFVEGKNSFLFHPKATWFSLIFYFYFYFYFLIIIYKFSKAESFRVKVYTPDDTIFTSTLPPVINVPEDGVSFKVQWNTDLLHYYKVKPGTAACNK